MIFALLFATVASAQTDVLLGQYFHARAEAELVEYLEARGTSVSEAAAQDAKSVCAAADEFNATLDPIKDKAAQTLKNLQQGGTQWRSPATYGDAAKVLMTPERATSYAVERLRFARLEAFGRLSRLSPGCLDVFRRDPTGAEKNIADIPRFRLESIKNVNALVFCSVTVNYWREMASRVSGPCKIATED